MYVEFILVRKSMGYLPTDFLKRVMKGEKIGIGNATGKAFAFSCADRPRDGSYR